MVVEYIGDNCKQIKYFSLLDNITNPLNTAYTCNTAAKEPDMSDGSSCTGWLKLFLKNKSLIKKVY